MFLANNSSVALQTHLAMYCRTGNDAPATSIPQHTYQYRRLVFNAVKDTLKTAFPITRQLIGKKRWNKSVAYFFENHACQTPQIWKLPEEFCTFYAQNQWPFKKDFLFLTELLQYEWLEIEVFMMDDLPHDAFKPDYQTNSEMLVPNPEVKILPLTYPLHIKNLAQITATDQGQYFVTFHRHPQSKQVLLNDLSYPMVEVLLAMHQPETSYNDLISILSKYESDLQKAAKILYDFTAFALENGLLLGYKN